uniref:Adenylate kinase n=1 Tax=Macrostomum lignano TaxID=282301 RepID=A0A1I8JRZ1_9PLAT
EARAAQGHPVREAGVHLRPDAPLSTGELLRTEIALGAARPTRLRRTMLNNDLVPVADVLRLLGNAMRARLLDSPGFLINGCPKDREQAMAFEMMLVPCRVVVFLDVPRRCHVAAADAARQADRSRGKKTLSVVKYFERQGKLVRWTVQAPCPKCFSRVRDGLMNFRPKRQPASR